jgi:lipid A 3-O-deacylase
MKARPMPVMKPGLYLLAGALLFGHAHAGVASLFDDLRFTYAAGVSAHIVDIDNDTLLLDRKDGFYSSGLRYTHKRTLADSVQAKSVGWRVGQELYTPSDIKLPASQVGAPDRPYAGWLYVGAFHEEYRVDGTHTRIGFDAGCLGSCAGGEWTQKQFHRVLSQPLPRGWSRQVRNEPGLVLYADIAPVRWRPTARFDITPSIKGRFGNVFTDFGAGLLLRAGRIEQLPGRSTLHVYARSDIHAVAYNATLQGGYFSKNNPHTVAPRRVVGEAEIGVAWADGPYALRAGVVRRSNEIKALPSAIGAQNYVRLQFVYAP